jgi:hypothetical protein
MKEKHTLGPRGVCKCGVGGRRRGLVFATEAGGSGEAVAGTGESAGVGALVTVEGAVGAGGSLRLVRTVRV